MGGELKLQGELRQAESNYLNFIMAGNTGLASVPLQKVPWDHRLPLEVIYSKSQHLQQHHAPQVTGKGKGIIFLV